jgi:hypothetical protein
MFPEEDDEEERPGNVLGQHGEIGVANTICGDSWQPGSSPDEYVSTFGPQQSQLEVWYCMLMQPNLK